jgi:hypothetical protein
MAPWYRLEGIRIKIMNLREIELALPTDTTIER